MLYRKFDIKWLQGLATMMLSFNCQITFFYVRGEMRSKTRRRVKKVLRNLISLEFIFYLTIGLSGYFSLGDKMTPGVYTLRRPQRKFPHPTQI
jgi:amino acid permease